MSSRSPTRRSTVLPLSARVNIVSVTACPFLISANLPGPLSAVALLGPLASAAHSSTPSHRHEETRKGAPSECFVMFTGLARR